MTEALLFQNNNILPPLLNKLMEKKLSKKNNETFSKNRTRRRK